MTQSRRIPPRAPHAVEMLAFPGVQLLDVTGPMQIFASANEALSARAMPHRYALSLVAAERLVLTSAGLGLVATPFRSVRRTVDTVIVPGGAGVDAAMADRRLLAWIRRRAGVAQRTVSVCTGAFLLAKAGLLDRRSAATHWARCAELARCFPSIDVQPKPIFVRDGPVWSSAGVTAGMDLCLALIEEDVGRDIALDVAKDLVMFLKRPGDQAQFSHALSLQRAGLFDHLHGWIRENLAGDLSVPALAQRCGMSDRTFSRRYRAELGCSPARMVEQIRIEAAQGWLADTADPLKVIAVKCGFASEDVLRRRFLRQTSVTPREYRQLWRRVPDS